VAEPVAHIQPSFPDSVTLYRNDLTSPRFTPRELDQVKEKLGRSFSAILTDEETDDKFTVLAWLKLRREGYSVGWDQIRDVVISVRAEDDAPMDPTTEQPRTT
jgi:hypothetical protein